MTPRDRIASRRLYLVSDARGGGAELARGGHQRVVAERLVAQLDDVDAAAQRRGEELARAGVADEVQAGVPYPLTSVHGSYNGKSTTGARDRAERAAPGRRPSNLIRVVPA